MTQLKKIKSPSGKRPSIVGVAVSADERVVSVSDRKHDVEQRNDVTVPAKIGKSAVKRTRAAPLLLTGSHEEVFRNFPNDDEIKKIYGLKTTSGANGLKFTVLTGLGMKGDYLRSMVLAMGAEMEPVDMIEAMLVQQIAVTHCSMMRASGHSWDAERIEVIEAQDRIMNRLARTFASQTEAFRRHRAGGNQSVRVGQVTVNDGGQAIVGDLRSATVNDEK